MYDFSEARERSGETADDRDEQVNELLNEYHTTAGYGDGPALAADDYDQYPDERADLANPDCSDLLQSLFKHRAVSDFADAADELSPVMQYEWQQALESATAIHNVDAERLFDEDDGDDVTASDVLDELLDMDDDLVRASNPLCVSELYAKIGLSTAEIADLLDTELQNVTETLRDCGLLSGYSNPEPSSESDYEQSGRRGGGLNIHA